MHFRVPLHLRFRLFLCVLLIGGFQLDAQAVTVTSTPTSCADVSSVGTRSWSNPANAQVQDANDATVGVSDNEISHYLQCSGYGFSIPTSTVINGITVTVRRMVNNNGGNPQDYSVQLLKANTVQGSDYASGTTYPTSFGTATYGGSVDLWGSAWSTADINNAGFGVAFSAEKNGTSGGSRTVSVDVISVSVDYTVDATPPTVSSIVLANTNPTNGVSSVSWTVTFSESVTGVNASDFALVQSGGVSGASITSVTGSGTTWGVTATTGSGTGSLGLNALNDGTITDLAANALTSTGFVSGKFVGAVYTVSAFLCSPPSNIPTGVTVSCVCDNFNRAALNPSTIFGQNWIVSLSNNDATGILPSIVNSGYLRLTNNTGNNSKAATLPAAFPASGNYISVEFTHYAYNGSGADGIAVTLSDYSVPAVPGASGGSLGYAQKTGINGFAGGWVGVALDEYGNYQNPTEGRIGGSGFLPETIGVRGSGSGTTGYQWLQGNASALSPAIDSPGSTTPAFGYRYQVVVDARNSGLATPQTFVAVNRDVTGIGNSYSAIFPQFDAYARAVTLGFTQAAVPSNWQISFTGSTGGSTNIHEIGSMRVCAQTVVPPTGGVASGFAAIDEAYGAIPQPVQNYLTGRIYTKLAGTSFKLNVAAINNSQIQTGYVLSGTKAVTVKLVDNSDGVCVLNSSQANYCSATCQAKSAVTGGSQTLSFATSDNGQKQSASFTIANAYSNLVALVSDASTTACSTDAFAVRPSAFTSVSSTATNVALTGSPSFKAGTDVFSMTVATTTSGYAGAAAVPTINGAGVAATGTAAAGWTVGAISPAAFPVATASSSTGTTFTYSEVGNFKLLGYNPATDTTSVRGIHDSTWTAVDQGTQQDCVAGSYRNTRDTSGTFATNTNYGKFGCLFGITADTALFGRFVPDHFTLVSGAVTPACVGTAKDFTYMGQPKLGLAYKIEARNGGDAKTSNYSAAAGVSYPVVAPSLVAEDQAAANQGCDVVSRISGAPAGTWTTGTYDATTAAASFARPISSPPATLNATTPATCTATVTNAGGPFSLLDIGLKMVDGSATLASMDMDAASAGVCSGVGCTAKKLGTTIELLGRLRLSNAYGSELLPILVPVRAEYYSGSFWVPNTDDKCTTITAAALGAGAVTPSTGSSLAVSSASVALSPSATLVGGVTSFKITPTVNGAGTVDLVLNLGLGLTNLTNWCGSWSGPLAGTGSAPSPDLSYLAGDWCGAAYTKAPAVRIKFGSPKSSYIYLRERY